MNGIEYHELGRTIHEFCTSFSTGKVEKRTGKEGRPIKKGLLAEAGLSG